MKKLFFAFAMLCTLALAGAASYAYFVYIPEKVEQKITAHFNNFGFENLSIGEITRKNGYILFSDISLDEKKFSTIKNLSVHFSLFKFLLNPDHAQKIKVHGLTLTGELSEDMELTLSGWQNDKEFLQNFRKIPATMLTLENSTIDLLSDQFGGIKIDLDTQIRLAGADDITIKGRIKSKQKKLGFHAKIDGSISSDGRLSIHSETEQISLTRDHVAIKRGVAKIDILHALKSKETFVSVDANLASVNWQNLPLRDVHLTLEKSGKNYNFSADGRTYGPENIEWTSNINTVNDVIKAETTITPNNLAGLRTFLERNKRLTPGINFPGFALSFEEPVISVNTVITNNTIEGDFKVLMSDPNFEITGLFMSDEETENIKGEFVLDPVDLTPLNEEGNTYDKTRFVVDAKGDFVIKGLSQDISKQPNLEWSAKANIDKGNLDFDILNIGNIKGKFTYDSRTPDKTKSRLNLKLPIKSNFTHSGRLKLNITDKEKPMLQTMHFRIYDGKMRTELPIFTDGQIRKENKLVISDISLRQLFHDAGFNNIVVSGQMGGVIPFKIDDRKMSVSGGILQSQEGGIIRLPENIILDLFPGNTPKMYKIRAALENYRYDFFEVRLDGDMAGRILMTLNASGYNPDFKNKDPIDLNLQIETNISLLFDKILN